MTASDNLSLSAGPEGAQKLLRQSGKLLFRQGVQIRLIAAQLSILVFVFLPYLLLAGIDALFQNSILTALFFYPLALSELFLVLPLFSALPEMVYAAAKGEEISFAMLFRVFEKKRYWRSFCSSLFFFLLTGFCMGVGISAGYGVMVLYALALGTGATAPYAGCVLVLGIFFLLFVLLVLLLLYRPFYLVLSLRARDETLSLLQAIRLSKDLMRGELPLYLRLRVAFLGLDVLSVCSILALFPIFTIPHALITNACCAEFLIAEKGIPSDESADRARL